MTTARAWGTRKNPRPEGTHAKGALKLVANPICPSIFSEQQPPYLLKYTDNNRRTKKKVSRKIYS